MWMNTDTTRQESAHYSVMRLLDSSDGMDALRAMFPEANADEMNFVLFSTSGVHGTYNTIEEAEAHILGKDEDGYSEITFVIIHPRLCSIRYGVCNPETAKDIAYLKALRASSHKAAASIGAEGLKP